MKLKLFNIFLSIFWVLVINMMADVPTMSTPYYASIQIDRDLLKLVSEEDQERVENRIKKYLKRAYNQALLDVKNNLNAIVNKNGDSFPTTDIQSALSKLITDIENYQSSTPPTGKLIVIKFGIDKQILNRYTKPFTREDLADPDQGSISHIFGDKNCLYFSVLTKKVFKFFFCNFPRNISNVKFIIAHIKKVRSKCALKLISLFRPRTFDFDSV